MGTRDSGVIGARWRIIMTRRVDGTTMEVQREDAMDISKGI